MNKKNGIAIIGLDHDNFVNNLAQQLAQRGEDSPVIVLGDLFNKELDIKVPEINLRDLLPKINKRRKINKVK